MFRFIRHKIANKKWLNFCLFIGVIMLSGFLCVYPMFREGSLNKLLNTLMNDYIETNNEYPAIFSKSGRKFGENTASIDFYDNMLDEYENTWTSYVDCDIFRRQRVYHVTAGYCKESVYAKTKQAFLYYIPEMEEHSEIVHGVSIENAWESDNELVLEALENGAVPCIISERTMDDEGWVVGETFNSKITAVYDKESMDFVIVGVFAEKYDGDAFWHKRANSFAKGLFFSREAFDEIVHNYCISGAYYEDYVMLDYTQINENNEEEYYAYIQQFKKLDGEFETNLENTFLRYEENKKSISVILFTFELPIVALLLLFIYMISGQILEMETGEIAMLKSRGISRFKVILLYLLQSAVISAAGTLAGIPIGFFFGKLAASTDAFLTFTFKDTSLYRPVWTMLLFALMAFVLALLFMTIPVIPLSKYTITERRSAKITSKAKAFWEKYFLDIPIIGLASYLLYNYSKQKETMALDIITNGNVDPVVFLDSSLFILGCGLVALRLIHYLVRLIYKIGRTKWKPGQYVAFLQIIRSSKRQGFISVFLVMTIAMGIFNANLARSVNVNMEERDRYNVGCDLKVQELWQLNTTRIDATTLAWDYKEPNYGRFEDVRALGVESMTRVIIDEKTNVKISGTTENNCLLMGINTKEFGQTAKLREGLNDTHWFNYLNALAQEPKGVIISSNLAKKYELEVGDSIEYTRTSPVSTKDEYAKSKAKIVGIVDAFPGFESTVYTYNEDGSVSERENFLVVANYANVVTTFRTRPYEVWMKLSDDAKPKEIFDKLDELGVRIKYSYDTEQIVQTDRDSALIQITNGMFSIGFIISLIICGVGFLIYWILTIKERELIYGIYRAMGLTMKEIFGMLAIEQIFSSLIACAAGFGVGMLTTKLFTALIAIVYLPRKHNLPIEVFFKAQDSMKMVIIVGGVLILCFIVIIRLIKKLNITKAIKLGED